MITDLSHWFTARRKHPLGPSKSDSTRTGRGRRRRRLSLETLESRRLLATITWAASGGGDWDTATNWSPQQVPGSGDEAIINLSSAGTVSLSSNNADEVYNVVTNSKTALNIENGSLAFGAGSSTLGGPVTVGPAASMTVAAGASVTIGAAQTLTDNGTLTFGSGDSVSFPTAQYGTTEISVTAGAVLNATSTTFVNPGLAYGSTNQIVVNSGGTISPTGSTFNVPIFVPYNDVSSLAGNVSFDNVNIDPGTLTSGEVDLNLIGTVTTNLLYVFPSGFTVGPGTTLKVAAGVNVQISADQTLTDNGTLTFGSLDSVSFPTAQYDTTQIVVDAGGVLNATSTTFVNPGLAYGSTNQISVSTGGTISPTGSTFNVPIFVPYNDVASLSGNYSFDNVNIIAGTLTSGEVDLNLIGTVTTNLLYVFPAGFTVGPGATLKVAAGVNVQISADETLTDNGTLTFGSQDSVSFPTAQYDTTQIVVTAGGVLNATSTTFVNPGLAYGSTNQISVNTGGTISPTGSTFNVPIFVPYNDVASLSGNYSFDNVNIIAGTLTSGEVDLNLIGTVTTNLLYVFPSGFTVGPGTTLKVAAGVNVQISADQTLTDNGTLTFGSQDSVSFPTAQYDTTQIVVTAGGVLNATSTTFVNPGLAYGSINQISVNTGGTISPTGSTFNVPIFVPYNDVSSLSGNYSFDNVNIIAGTLTSGEVDLNLIGTVTTNLLYVFPAGFTVGPGATLKVAAGVNVQISAAQTLTDNGTLTFGSNDSVSFPTAQYDTTQILVTAGGVLNAASTTFLNPGLAYGSTNQISVTTGGTINPTGSTFNVPIFVPYNDVASLAGNYSFDDINIIAGTLSSGEVDLNLFGTVTTNLLYVFPAGFTVSAGATLKVAAGVNVQISAAQSLTDNGTLTFGSQDSVSFPTAQYDTTQIVVTAGAVLNATSTTFVNPGLAYGSTNQISVNTGGTISPTGSTFNVPIFVPYNDVASLAGNYSFDDINIIAGTLTSGEVDLNLIGIVTTNLLYVFPGGFTVGSGTTLKVAAGVNVQISAAQTLTDNGTLTFGSLDTVSFPTAQYDTTQIVVNGGGVLNATSTTFINPGLAYGSLNQIVVNSGGTIAPTGSTFNLPIFVPYNDVAALAGNVSFDDININPGTLSSGEVDLNLIGTVTTNLLYVFPSGFTVSAGATLKVAAGVDVQIGAAQTLTDNGTLVFLSQDSVSFPTAEYDTTQIVVGTGGVLNATSTTFVNPGLAYDSTEQVVINSGGKLVVTGGTDAVPSLLLNSGSNDTLGSVAVTGKITINSAATINIAGNDFSNVPSQGIIAAGNNAVIIDLEYNYWGTTVGTQIAAKLLDNANNSSLPVIDYSNPLTTTEPFKLVVTGYPSPTAAGAAGNFTVTVESLYGAVVTGYTGTVQFESSDPLTTPGSGLPLDYTFTTGSGADNGVHTFSATLKTAGSQWIIAEDTTTKILGVDSGIAVTPGVATSLAVSQFPSPTAAGVSQSFIVSALDQYGNVATGYTGTVHFTSSDSAVSAGHGLPADYTFTTGAGDDDGVHTFDATLNTVGTQSITATDTSNSSITGTQSGIKVNPAPASTLVISAYPSSTTAGVGQTFTVTLYDPKGNVATGYTGTIHFTSSDSLSTAGNGLPADYTFTSGVGDDDGTHTFTATLKTAGTQSITATDTTNSALHGTQSGIVVNPTAASIVVVSAYPSPTTSGVAQSFTVTAKDPYGNLATGYTGTIHFTSSDTKVAAGNGLPANYTFTTGSGGDNGIHSFTATLKTAGAQAITATDTSNSSDTGTESGIIVNPAAASTLVVSAYPSPTTAGIAHNFTVTVFDPNGNVATGYTGTVHFTSSDSLATAGNGLPTNYTFTGSGGDRGVHTFSATLKSVGTQSITATDTAVSSISGTQSGIIVNPAVASTLVVSAYPSPTTSGATHSFTVTVYDSLGNIAAGYTGNIQVTSSDAKVTAGNGLPANYTFTTGSGGDNGTHTFTATLATAGTQSITATDTANSSISGTQSGIIVNPAAASTLVVSAYPSPTTSGAAHNFTVTVYDANGNVATGYTGTIHFTSSDTKATAGNGLPANYTFTTGSGGDNGVHAFSATLKTAGTQSITATDTASSSISGTQSGILVTSTAASTLELSGYPSPTPTDVAHNFTVTVLDANGNVATGYIGTIHFTSTDSQSTAGNGLPTNYTFTTGSGGDNGTHTFSATLQTPGTQSITATDTANSSINGTQSGIVVVQAVASKLVISGYAPTTTAGQNQTFTVTAEDSNGNVATDYTGTVAFTSSDGQISPGNGLPLNYTFTTGPGGDDGVHTFTGTLKTAGSQSITATDTQIPGITGTESNITTNAAGAIRIVTRPPGGVIAGKPFTVTAYAEDPYNNVDPTYSKDVSVALASGPGMLTGNQTMPATNGVAAFNLVDTKTGNITLSATSGTLTGSTTPPIPITPSTPYQFAVTTSFASPDVAGTAGAITVTAEDQYGNPENGSNPYSGSVKLTSTDSRIAGLPSSYAFQTGDAGTHVFENVVLETAGSQSITATDSASSAITGTSPTVTVVPGAVHDFLVATSLSSPDVAGTAGTVTVTAKDLYGNTDSSGPNLYRGTVDLSSTDSQLAGLPSTYAFSAGDAGIHVFSSVALETAGSQSFTATDAGSSTTTGTSPQVNVISAAAHSLVVTTTFDDPDVAGTPATVTVTAIDAYGNTAASGQYQYHGTVDLTSTDGLESGLPSTYRFVPGDAGSHVFNNVVLESAGNQSITATDNVFSTITGTSQTVNVIPAAAYDFIVSTTFPNPDVAGSAASVDVSVEDRYGNVENGPTPYLGTVDLSSTDDQIAGLPATYAFVPADAGSHAFNSMAFKTAGSQSITATDSASSTITGTSPSVNVVPAATHAFLITTSFSDPDVAGTAGTVTITAQDLYGNPSGGLSSLYEGTVDLTGTDIHMAGLPSTYKFLAADLGSHVFNNVVLKTASSQSITATDSASSAITGTSPQVNVVPAAAHDFIIATSFVSPLVAGTSGTVTITTKDLYGNTVSNGPNQYRGTVDLTSTDLQIAGLPANYAFADVDAGSHVFNAVVLETAGNQSITATDSASSAITGSSPLVYVIPAATHDFLVTTSFANPDVVAGTTGTVTVTAKDLFGNATGSSYQGTVDLTGGDGHMAGLPSTYKFLAADDGSHVFNNVVLETAGNQSITATDSFSSTVTGTSPSVSVVPAPVHDFLVTTSFASPDVAGTVGTVTVTAQDRYGNTVGSGVNDYHGTVNLSSTDAQQVGLPASHTFTSADNGSYTFTGVELETAGSRTITATDSTSTTISGIATVNVTAAAASQLVLSIPPPDPIIVGQPFSISITAVDQFGNVATGYSSPVAISLPNEPGVSGSIPARNGVATFTGLTASTASPGSSIQITAAGFKPISSKPVPINPPVVSTPPTVDTEQVWTTQKTNSKGKKIGKPIFTGFKIVFSEAMSQATAGSIAGYQVDRIVTKTVKRKKKPSLVPVVSFTPSFNPSNNTVSLMISGKNLFKLGGQITIVTTPPNAVTSSAGVAVSGTTVFHILPNAKHITTGSAL